MAELSYIAVTPDGVDDEGLLTAADVAGDTFPASTNKLFRVLNGDASPHTVTIAAPVSETSCGAYGQLAVSDIAITVPAGESRLFTIPLGYASGGLFALTYDAVTSVSVGGFAYSANS